MAAGIVEREKKIRKVTLWGAVVNLLLTGGKIAAGVFGRSAAMIADGVHSLSDLVSDAVVLIFTHISSKGKDRDHSFGHGKFETLATLIVSLILIVVGARLMNGGVRSIIDILNGEVPPRPGYIALVAAVVYNKIRHKTRHSATAVWPQKQFLQLSVSQRIICFRAFRYCR